jgi:hypothetical protein
VKVRDPIGEGPVQLGRLLRPEKRHIRETVQGHLETLRQFGDPIPEPSSLAGEIEITAA